MDERATAELEGLRERDELLAEEAARLREVELRVALIRRRVEAITGELETFPREFERLSTAAADAAEEVERRQVTAEEAARELESHHDDETWERLERAVTRAQERAAAALGKFERATAAAEQLEGDAAELPGELAALELEARALAETAPTLGAPGPGADALVAWASRAQAELFVEVGQLDRQRENVIREANELATMLLGESTYGSTVAQAAERVQQSIR
jgi:chromosome segregation ATPase